MRIFNSLLCILVLTTGIATEESANKVMTLLRADATGHGINEQSFEIPLPFLDGGGLKSTHLVSFLYPRFFRF